MNKNSLLDQKITSLIVVIIILSVVFLIYYQVSSFEFINYDDPNYISYSAKEFSLRNITSTFLSTSCSNWHPLTWLSLMLDYHLYGSNAGGYHITNLIFHLINTLLLFLVLKKMTGSIYRSGFVAALFALHPLHVESVAWVTERKDVLSTMFWILTMWAYVRYSEKPSLQKYLVVIVLFVLGLMSKPMLVTLPFVLLLMDYWPLGRVNWGQNIPELGVSVEKKNVSFLFVEKIPLFILTCASSLLTYVAQNKNHSVASFDAVSLFDRISNAINSYILYLTKIFWFQSLSPFYIYSNNFESWKIGVFLLIIFAITGLALAGIKKYPYLAFGWFGYLGTLIPVIGIIQVGFQAMADRYTYVPLIGIFIAMAWGIAQLLSGIQYGKFISAAAAISFLMIITLSTYSQISIWKDNFTLFEHALRLDSGNYQAYTILGLASADRGDYEKAIYYHWMAIKYNPEFYPAYNYAGTTFYKMGNVNKAINCYKKGLRINAKFAVAHYNLGIALMKNNNLNEAIFHFNKALEIKPDDYGAHNNLGVALMKTGYFKEALTNFQEALRWNPDGKEAQKNRDIALDTLNKDKKTISD